MITSLYLTNTNYPDNWRWTIITTITKKKKRSYYRSIISPMCNVFRERILKKIDRTRYTRRTRFLYSADRITNFIARIGYNSATGGFLARVPTSTQKRCLLNACREPISFHPRINPLDFSIDSTFKTASDRRSEKIFQVNILYKVIRKFKEWF